MRLLLLSALLANVGLAQPREAGVDAVAEEIAKEQKAQAELPRTDPKTWAKVVWQGLRWGMGPGDVRERLKVDSSVPLHVTGYLDRDLEAALDGTIFGVPVVGRFGFEEGRLVTIHLRPNPKRGMDKTNAFFPSWFSSLRFALTKKYGKPMMIGVNSEQRCLDEEFECGWRTLDSSVYIYSHVGIPDLEDSGECSTGLVYKSTAHEQREKQRSGERLKKEMEKL
jgi:hypothetical protein